MSSPDAGRRTRGVVLVELMVGIALGLLVVATALGACAFTLSTAAAGRDAADLQQRGDMALQLIGTQVRQAGAVRLEPLAGAWRFSAVFDGWRSTGMAVSGVEGGAGRPDVLRVSRQPVAGEPDCLGNAPRPASPAGAPIQHLDAEFYVDREPRNRNRPALYCGGSDTDTPPQAMVAGVEDMQLWFAIRDADGRQRYVTADALGPGSAVEAVRVCLQVSSEGGHGAAGFLDCNGMPIPAARSAGRMVRLVRGVFMVRNAAA